MADSPHQPCSRSMDGPKSTSSMETYVPLYESSGLMSSHPVNCENRDVDRRCQTGQSKSPFTGRRDRGGCIILAGVVFSNVPTLSSKASRQEQWSWLDKEVILVQPASSENIFIPKMYLIGAALQELCVH